MDATKAEKIERGMCQWVSFYRANPHRFAQDYLGMKWLAMFQCILHWNIASHFMPR